MTNSTALETVVENKPEQKQSQKAPKESIWTRLASQKGYVYLLPAIIFLAIFTIYPIFNTVIIAFINNYDSMENMGFGFANFSQVVNYPDFIAALVNTLIFALVSVPISTLLALLISVWLNRLKFLQKAYQTIFFLPYLTNALAIGAVFMSMFGIVRNSSNGFINDMTPQFIVNFFKWINPDMITTNTINGVAHEVINWVNVGSTPGANRFVVIVYSVWRGLPFKILILFSALQSVNKQYYDAAKIDGANKSRILWKVTVPLISPMISYLLVTGFMGGLKEYSSVLGIFGPKMGPNKPTMQTMVGFIYDALSKDAIGLASAGAIILFCIILVVTIINMYVSKKKVHY